MQQPGCGRTFARLERSIRSGEIDGLRGDRLDSCAAPDSLIVHLDPSARIVHVDARPFRDQWVREGRPRTQERDLLAGRGVEQSRQDGDRNEDQRDDDDRHHDTDVAARTPSQPLLVFWCCCHSTQRLLRITTIAFLNPTETPALYDGSRRNIPCQTVSKANLYRLW